MQVNFFYINIHRITSKNRYLWDLGSSVPLDGSRCSFGE